MAKDTVARRKLNVSANHGYGKAKEGINYSWDKMLQEYIAHKKKYGRNPKSHGGSSHEERLYYWMYNQTRLIITGYISEAHLQKLIEAGVDIPNRGNLYERYMNNIAAIRERGIPDPGDALYLWAMKQAKTKLCDWQQEAWDSLGINPWELGAENKRWYNRYCLIAGKKAMDSSDRTWYKGQKRLLDTGSLPEWKANLITKLSKKVPVSKWEKMYNEYMDFQKKTGGKPSQSEKSQRYNAVLYNWQRHEINALRAGQRTWEQVWLLQEAGICA